MVALLARGTDIEVVTPYNQQFVTALKTQVPYSARRYDPETKRWLVAGKYGTEIQTMILKYFGRSVPLPKLANNTPLMNLIEVLYLGRAKMRSDGTSSASGWHNNGWNVVFPTKTLKAYFQPSFGAEQPDTATLYSLLGIQGGASAAEIQTGFRRMAKQWHPDVCREPDAQEMFLKIKDAYETLSNPGKRARYDLGLKMAATLSGKYTQTQHTPDDYTAPFRSGLVLASYTEQVGLKVVERIHHWADIVDAQGRTLVSSWASGADAPTLNWV